MGAAPAEADRARPYDAWYETALGAAAHRIELRLVAALAAPERGARALDAGCGTGIYTAWLTEQGLEVTGLDRDPAMLAAARGKAPGAQLVEGTRSRCRSPRASSTRPSRSRSSASSTASNGDRQPASSCASFVPAAGSWWVGLPATASGRRSGGKGWLGSGTWRPAHFATAGELRRLLQDAGATTVSARYGLYLLPCDAPRSLAGRRRSSGSAGRWGSSVRPSSWCAASRAAVRRAGLRASDQSQERLRSSPQAGSAFERMALSSDRSSGLFLLLSFVPNSLNSCSILGPGSITRRAGVSCSPGSLTMLRASPTSSVWERLARPSSSTAGFGEDVT